MAELDWSKYIIAEAALYAKHVNDPCLKCIGVKVQAIVNDAASTRTEPQAKIDAMTAALEAALTLDKL